MLVAVGASVSPPAPCPSLLTQPCLPVWDLWRQGGRKKVQGTVFPISKTAVDTIFVGKERVYNHHFLVDPVACTPVVQDQAGSVRGRFLTPRLRAKSFDELNTWLLDKCLTHAKTHDHAEPKEQAIWQAFEIEWPSLVPYAGRFYGFHD